MNLVLIIAGALVLGFCAIAAVEAARRRRKLYCPRCFSRDVHEDRGWCVCERCDEHWQQTE